MTKLLILVLTASLAAVAYGQTVNVIPIQDNVTDSIPIQPTIKPSPTPPPTTKPPTSPPTPPPTTKPPTPPPTTKPPTPPPTTKPPTPPPTTKPPTPPPTTKPPTPPPTTIPPKPTPAPVPPKPSEPTVGTWQLNYTKSNTSCVLLEFALQTRISYNTTNNKTFAAFVNVPSNAVLQGSCSESDIQMVELHWMNTNNVSNIVSLNFTRNSTYKVYKLADIEVSINPDSGFPGIDNASSVFNLKHTHDEFKTPVSKSYKCAKKQELNLTDTNANNTRGLITVSHLQFQVFHNTTDKHFTDVEDCAPSDTPDVVPIAVGCALAALVIIVLIAYLIGRRRGQARGYLSMFTETKHESEYIPMKTLSCFN